MANRQNHDKMFAKVVDNARFIKERLNIKQEELLEEDIKLVNECLDY